MTTVRSQEYGQARKNADQHDLEREFDAKFKTRSNATRPVEIIQRPNDETAFDVHSDPNIVDVALSKEPGRLSVTFRTTPYIEDFKKERGYGEAQHALASNELAALAINNNAIVRSILSANNIETEHRIPHLVELTNAAQIGDAMDAFKWPKPEQEKVLEKAREMQSRISAIGERTRKTILDF